MTTYTVNLNLGHSTISPDTTEAAEAAEAETPFESWLGWLENARDEIDENEGDPDDLGNVLAVVLEHVVGGGPDAVAAKEKRAEEILRKAQDANDKVTVFLQRQREARKQRAVEAKAFAERLDGLANAVAAVKRENSELRATLAACEQNLERATDLLTKEIAKERSLRRLLDAQRSRPHTQKVASELARRFAQKTLENAMKGSSKEEAA